MNKTRESPRQVTLAGAAMSSEVFGRQKDQIVDEPDRDLGLWKIRERDRQRKDRAVPEMRAGEGC